MKSKKCYSWSVFVLAVWILNGCATLTTYYEGDARAKPELYCHFVPSNETSEFYFTGHRFVRFVNVNSKQLPVTMHRYKETDFRTFSPDQFSGPKKNQQGEMPFEEYFFFEIVEIYTSPGLTSFELKYQNGEILTPFGPAEMYLYLEYTDIPCRAGETYLVQVDPTRWKTNLEYSITTIWVTNVRTNEILWKRQIENK